MILLDTHVLVHYTRGDKRVGKRSLSTIDRAMARDELFVSALSFWEIAMLVAKNRLAFDTTVSGFRAAALGQGILELPVDGDIAIAAGELPSTHGDPTDRMLVATTMMRGLTLLTADDVLLQWRMSGYRAQDATAQQHPEPGPTVTVPARTDSHRRPPRDPERVAGRSVRGDIRWPAHSRDRAQGRAARAVQGCGRRGEREVTIISWTVLDGAASDPHPHL